MDASHNPSMAFYLHPVENPIAVLVTPSLDGTNYHAWSRSMKRALMSKNKFKFMNSDIQELVSNDDMHEPRNTATLW